MHPVFPSRPVALAAPRLVICFRARGHQLLPSGLERNPRLIERLGDPTAMLTGVSAGMEAARPAPLRGQIGNAGASADDANPDVAEVDQPRAVGIVLAATAAEDGMLLGSGKRMRPANCQLLACGGVGEPLLLVGVDNGRRASLPPAIACATLGLGGVRQR